MLAPIVLFLYNRLSHTKKTVEALQKNELASESELFVFCDGPKQNASPEQREEVLKVQNYADCITGFKEVHVENSPQNKGLANSVIAGVTKIINQYGKVIVVEDDIITHKFFLRYMNDCLEIFKDRKDIFMIGGYNCNINIPKNYKDDIYVTYRSCSWGWATWKDCWNKADWTVRDYKLMENNICLQNKFNRGGHDMFPMLVSQMNGKIDSWAIRWDYCMYKNDALCVYPVKTMCDNAGFDGTGVHCGYMPVNYTAPLYDSSIYNIYLNKNIAINKRIIKEFSYFKGHGGQHLPSFMQKMMMKIKNIIKARLCS